MEIRAVRDKKQKNRLRRVREARERDEATKDNESRCREEEGERGTIRRETRSDRETVLYTPMHWKMSAVTGVVVVVVIVDGGECGEEWRETR